MVTEAYAPPETEEERRGGAAGVASVSVFGVRCSVFGVRFGRVQLGLLEKGCGFLR